MQIEIKLFLACILIVAVMTACGSHQVNPGKTQTHDPADLAASRTALVTPVTATSTSSPTVVPSSTPTLNPEPTPTPTITPTPSPQPITPENAAQVVLLDTLKGFDGVSGILFSPQGVAALRVSEDNILQKSLVELHIPTTDLGQSTWTFAAPAFSPDGSKYVSQIVDQGYVFTLNDVTEDMRIKPMLRGIFGNIYLKTFFVYSSDGKFLVRISYPTQMQTFPPDYKECFPDCRFIQTYIAIHGIIYDLTSGKILSELNLNNVKASYSKIEVSPDNAYLATMYTEDDMNKDTWITVQLWHVDDGSLYRTLDAVLLKSAEGEVANQDYSPDGMNLALIGGGKLRSWQWEADTFLWAVDGIYSALDYSPDGSLLAVGAPDGSIQLIQASDGTTLTTLSGHDHVLTYVAFSPDGSLLASLDESGTLKLWSVPR